MVSAITKPSINPRFSMPTPRAYCNSKCRMAHFGPGQKGYIPKEKGAHAGAFYVHSFDFYTISISIPLCGNTSGGLPLRDCRVHDAASIRRRTTIVGTNGERACPHLFVGEAMIADDSGCPEVLLQRSDIRKRCCF